MTVQIMGIVNVSPDSFAGDGVAETEALQKRITQQLQQGADILDIGGQSTRPGAEIITTETEIARVVPAITIARSLTDKPISVDTFKPEVAKAALEAGADIINDVTGVSDPKMLDLLLHTSAKVVVMHSRGTPQTMSQLTDYPEGLVPALRSYFAERTAVLTQAGIAPERIIIDPGIGFAKTAAQSLEATKHLEEFVSLGFQVLYAASQKSFIGKVMAGKGATQPAPLEERVVGTTVTTMYAMQHGATIIRVHDVKAAVQVRTMLKAIDDPTMAA